MDGSDEDCDFGTDFIRRPKCYHSTPRLSSISRNDSSWKISLTSSSNISPVVRNPPRPIFVNHFLPDGKVIATKERAQTKFKRLSISELTPTIRSNLDDSTDLENLPECDGNTSLDMPIRPRLSELNVSRFIEEFIVLDEIGKGVYGCVYRCLNIMNGIIYAVKRSLHPIKSSFEEKIARNEICAHGILFHDNIIRNYSCWIEEGHVFIQNEYCDLGSLEEYTKTNSMSESLLLSLLLQMAQALKYLHNKGLAHMDIKPENILLKSDNSNENDSGIEEKTDNIIFKLSDFGRVTSLDEECDFEEGDCRYLSREVLEGNPKCLDKSDIFSLGLTVYEISGGGPLPKNGDEWQEIRNGKLKKLENLSEGFNNILKAMIHQLPEKRPSASNLVKMIKLTHSLSQHAEDDFSYMHQYYHNNSRLEHKVETTEFYLMELFKSHRQLQDQLKTEADSFGYYSGDQLSSFTRKRRSGVANTRIVGKKAKRSNSTKF